MKVTTGPVTTADALKFADELEAAIGEVMNGQRKAGNLPVESMCRLIQFARDVAAKETGTPNATLTGERDEH